MKLTVWSQLPKHTRKNNFNALSTFLKVNNSFIQYHFQFANKIAKKNIYEKIYISNIINSTTTITTFALQKFIPAIQIKNRPNFGCLFSSCSQCSKIFLRGGAHIHTFVFTDHKNNWYQNKFITQNTNIWIWAPPPNYRACYGTGSIGNVNVQYAAVNYNCCFITLLENTCMQQPKV